MPFAAIRQTIANLAYSTLLAGGALVSMHYVGRFAPSPTGPLHAGSLLAAVASYCDAKAHGGRWLLRMEDLDTPRVMPGAAEHIIRTLAGYGFAWDGDILYQSQQSAAYEAALAQLNTRQLVYPCTCSRKEIVDSSQVQGIDGLIYPGTCLKQPIKPHAAVASRIQVHDFIGFFDDLIQGTITQTLRTDIGDFILKRADGLFAYQLAVVVDDAQQGITHIIRGADLLNSTPRQLYLQQVLGYAKPVYGHIPVITNAAGEKLSKQTKAAAITLTQASQQLYQALHLLNQQPPAELRDAPLATIWQWAFAHWQLAAISRTTSIQPATT